MYDGKWDWKRYLAQTFDQIACADALVIDLRGNEGGSAVGDELLGYLIDRPTSFDQYKLYTRYDKIPPDLKPYLDTWDRTFDDFSRCCGPSKFILAGRNSYRRMTLWDDPTRQTVVPKPNRFKGKVFVLSDGSNSSATFEFENAVRNHRLGTLVGEPTGGNLRGINGSAFYFLRLPNSKLEVDLPLVAQFPDHPQPDRGLKPDVWVEPTVQDIRTGRDRALGTVLGMLAGPAIGKGGSASDTRSANTLDLAEPAVEVGR